MSSRKARRGGHGPYRSNDRLTLGESIKRLRAQQKPYMSQKQLCYVARVSMPTLARIENNSGEFDIRLSTLRRIAWALGKGLFIKIKTKPYPETGECQLSNPELPSPPKRSGKTSAKGRSLAAEYGYPRLRSYRRQKRPAPKTEISDTPDLVTPEQNPFEAE